MTWGFFRARRRVLLLGGVAVAMLASGAPLAGAAQADQQVSYLGLRFDVPADWPVIDLTPTTCVRFDQHAVYLGTPGQQQNCPANVIGRTEALLVQPATGATTTTATDDTVSRQITATTSTARITGTYGSDRATIATALATAGLPAATPAPTGPPQIRPRVATASLPVDATNGSGEGFDACTAPSSADMTAWMGSSPYTNIGIYLGGPDATCSQPNLTASWVSAAYAQGWHFLPAYVGQQAVRGDITNPQVNGTQDADQAVTNAENLGFAPGSVLYYDMEAYAPAERGQAMVLEAAWTAELHRLGFLSGVYSSAGSGIADLAANYGGVSTPDAVWTARYNGQANTQDAVLPTGDFANHQRAHQYSGGTNQTYNAVTINVDSDYLDVGMSGAAIPPPLTSGLVSTTPARLLDTRSAIGVPTTTPLGGSSTLKLQVTGVDGIPSNVMAVVLNVTAVNPSSTSYLSVFPDGDPLPTVSNINFNPGQTVPNLVTVPVVDGAVDIFNHVGTVHVVADLFGYDTASGGQTYHQVAPTRLLDTRSGIGAPKAPLAAGQPLNLTVTGGTQNIPANVSAVIMNVTVVNPTANAYLTVYPSSQTSPPTASNLNFTTHEVISNLVIVPVTNGSIDFYTNVGTTDVIGDVMGYYTPDISSQFTPVSPARLLDTRTGTGTGGVVGAIGAGHTLKLGIAGTDGIPANVDAVVLNVTAISPTAGSFLAVFPDGQARPNVSNLNFAPGETIANLVVVPVTNGSIDIYNNAGNTDATADVAGYYVG